MKIIEEFISSKTHNFSDCEDAIFKSKDFIAIIDGATSKTKIKYNDRSPGSAGKLLVLECLKEFDHNINCHNAISHITKKIADFYKKNGIYGRVLKRPHERISISVIIFSKHYREIWMIGDCQCLIDGKLFVNRKKVDDLLASLRSLYINSELLKGKTIADLIEKDTGRNFIIPMLKRQYLFQNKGNATDYSYGVIDGFELQDKYVKIISDIHSKIIIFASDGYPKIFSSLSETESFLADVLETDPLCFKKYKSTKGVEKNNVSFDDRAYIKFKF